MNALRTWMVAKYDYLTGTILATYAGILHNPQNLTNLFTTVGICVLTGFAGALGAHLFKKVLDLYRKSIKPKHGY